MPGQSLSHGGLEIRDTAQRGNAATKILIDWKSVRRADGPPQRSDKVQCGAAHTDQRAGSRRSTCFDGPMAQPVNFAFGFCDSCGKLGAHEHRLARMRRAGFVREPGTFYFRFLVAGDLQPEPPFSGGAGDVFLSYRWVGQRFAAGLAFACNGLSLNCLLWTNNIAALGWMPWVIWIRP